MIHCPELNKNFATKEELYTALKKNADKIISLKKANVFKSIDKGNAVASRFIKSDSANKTFIEHPKKDHIYAVINTTNYFDSHNDVHFPKIWDKSVKEQQGKVFYVVEHSLKIDNVIAWKEDVNMIVTDIDWSSVGKNYQGKTQALIFEIPRNKIIKDSVMEIIDKNKDVQNSVRMQYVDIKLAVNSDDKDFAKQKELYDSLIPKIANFEDVEKNGYFWAINEAKIIKEGSMVLFGSNSATAIESIKNIEPSDDTQKTEPSYDTQKRSKLLI